MFKKILDNYFEKWYTSICDCCMKLELEDFQPDTIIIPKFIINGLYKRNKNLGNKDYYSVTWFLGMKVKYCIFPFETTITDSKVENKYYKKSFIRVKKYMRNKNG